MIRIPDKPRGKNRFDAKDAEIIEALSKIAVVTGKGIKVTHTSSGTVLDATGDANASGGGGSTVPRWG